MGQLSNGRPLDFSELQNDYYRWLTDLIDAQYMQDEYWRLLQRLHNIPFYWTIVRDENRKYDAVYLRERYMMEEGIDSRFDEEGGVSVLEMIVGVATRMDGMAEESQVPKYFWEIIGNLGLLYLDDENFYQEDGMLIVDDIIERMLSHDYPPNGKGSMFPLARGDKDQQKAEIWYQMNAYLLENYYLDSCCE